MISTRLTDPLHAAASRYISIRDRWLARRFVRRGRIPGSLGYGQYKGIELSRVTADPDLLEQFRYAFELPQGYGLGLDERIVEYPWALVRIPPGRATLLDAGSTLNYEWIAQLPVISNKLVVVQTLAPEGTLERSNYSYVYGDLRRTIFRDEVFDTIVCLSTLEHVGLDNTRFYTSDAAYREAETDAFLDVIREFSRLLRPGGRLLFSVPFGRYQNLGWLQQFDADRLRRAIEIFAGIVREATYYRYGPEGWQRDNDTACRDAEYQFRPAGFGVGGIATATAVACIHLERTS